MRWNYGRKHYSQETPISMFYGHDFPMREASQARRNGVGNRRVNTDDSRYCIIPTIRVWLWVALSYRHAPLRSSCRVGGLEQPGARRLVYCVVQLISTARQGSPQHE